MESLGLQTAVNVVSLAREGRFREICDLFSPALRPLVSADLLQEAWDAEVGRQGAIVAVGNPLSDEGAGGVLVKVPVACEHGGLTVVVSVTHGGQLAGLQLAPPSAAEPVAPWQPPDYADPANFGETDLTIGAGQQAVGGTLSMPHGARRGPAVVLLAGSGPNDRDETLGRNKPFKDLAWGLASRGVAVLRFDKVTFAHASEVAVKSDFTLADEYLPQALAAIEILRTHPGVDAGRIFVLGHSLGGTVAPMVASKAPSVAGLVIMAGGAQPLHLAMLRQVRYLASLDPNASAASAAALEALAEQVRRVDDPGLSPTTPATDLPFGVPAPYWLALRNYQPVTVAASLAQPMLLLQGGRDYQVTVVDDLALWEQGLQGRENVSIRVYPADNHLFLPGGGPSTPAELEPAQHLDPDVITDIAVWLAESGA